MSFRVCGLMATFQSTVSNTFNSTNGIPLLAGWNGGTPFALVSEGTTYKTFANSISITLTGSGFTYDGNGLLTGGTNITAIEVIDFTSGATNKNTYTITGLGTSLTVSEFLTNIGSLTNAQLLADILGGNDLINPVSGGSLNETLSGFGGNDTLSLFHAGDVLVGGDGDDIYRITAGSAVSLIELSGATGGNDTVLVDAVADFDLASVDGNQGIENIILTGTHNAVISGNSLNNRITGNGGADTLAGGQADTLEGGAGNDVYLINSTAVTITETSGTDSVIASANFTLGGGIENGSLTGAGTRLTGNSLANSLTGHGGFASTLSGMDGDDTLTSAHEDDVLAGGAGNDRYEVISYNDVTLIEGSGTSEGSADTVVLTGYANYDLSDYDTNSGIENIVVTADGGTNYIVSGNSLNNIISGGGQVGLLFDGADGDDTLSSASFGATLAGGSGNDVFFVDSSLSQAIFEVADNETDGTADTVMVSSSYFALETYDLNDAVENVILGSTVSGAILIGNSLDNTITANSLANTLQGGAGDDTLIGGAGDDFYVVDSEGDVVIESGVGHDEVEASVDFVLSAGVDDAYLTGGTDAVVLTGNSLSNVLTANEDFVSTLIGGAGNDTLISYHNDSLIGGEGNDVYILDGTATIVDVSGSDLVVTRSTSFDLGSSGIENVQAGSTSATSLTGNTLANALTGNFNSNSDDTLKGIGGNDTLRGYGGNDTYIIGGTTDVIIDDQGTADTVLSETSYTLPVAYTGIESAGLTGNGDATLTGNGEANYLFGNLGHNLLSGLGGADTLVAGTNGDTLSGGTGDDTYLFTEATASGTATSIVEAKNGGEDTVLATVSVDITGYANVENVDLTLATGAVNATGNSLANLISGNFNANVLTGGEGNDTLAGNGYLSATLVDTLVGGAGNDVYLIQHGNDSASIIQELESGGTDTILVGIGNYTLGGGIEVENLVQTDDAEDGVLVGNAFANHLTGNSYGNTLNGGGGEDILQAGGGDDLYIVGSMGVKVVEGPGTAGGHDLVQSSVSFDMSKMANVDDLTLTGTFLINGTGNASANYITGNSSANSLTGGSGNDTLDGNGGVDTLVGGAGNDLYVYTNTNVKIVEAASGGVDGVFVNADFEIGLVANIENAYLTASGRTLVGSSKANVLGGGGNSTLRGNGGNDTLLGYEDDVLRGGDDNDVYILNEEDITVEEDLLAGTDTVVLATELEYQLGANVENGIITYTGGAALGGNSLANKLTGGSGDDYFYIVGGGSLVDTLAGGGGDDEYEVGSTSFRIVEVGGTKGGTDTVHSIVSIDLNKYQNVENLDLSGATGTVNGTGNGLANYLKGNTAANTLSGGGGSDTLEGNGGNDTLIGGAGDDTYYYTGTEKLVEKVSGGGRDTIIVGDGDLSLEGTAIFTDTLLAFENITFEGDGQIGAGNSLANVLKASESGNTFLDGKAGNDTLYGLGGGSSSNVDTLQGGAGDDVYVLDSSDHVITESSSGGIDTIVLTDDVDDLSLGDFANVENVTATNTSGVILDGNSLANVIRGAAGDDTIYSRGDTVRDTLIGGAGDDDYFVDTTVDVITETGGTTAGHDAVYSSVSYALGANVEDLYLIGTVAVSGTGNGLDNLILGNNEANLLSGGAGDDTLVGGFGAGKVDTLTGGSGADLFVVNGYGDGGYSLITDFKFSDGDRLSLPGPLDQYVIGGQAELGGLGVNDRAIFEDLNHNGVFNTGETLVAVVKPSGNVPFNQDQLNQSASFALV